MRKLSKKQNLIILVALFTVVVIIALIVGANVIKTNITNSSYNSANNNSSSSNLLPEYIKEGITIGGITGTLVDLDTSDATAIAEDIIYGKTAYVNGIKITGTMVTREMLSIGDYVEYSPDTAEAYTLSTGTSGYSSSQTINQETNLEWRIYSINDDGTVDLISSTPTEQEVQLFGALGYNNGVYILNNICQKQYSNQELGTVARSINLEDIENKYSESGKSERDNHSSGGIRYGSSKTYQDYTYYPNLYAREVGSGINTTTVNRNGAKRSETYYSSPTSETYSKAESLTMTNYHYILHADESKFNEAIIYDLLIENAKDYWIASRYARTDPAYGYYGLKYKVDDDTRFDGANLYDGSSSTWVDSYPYSRTNSLRIIVTINTNIKFTGGDGSEERPYKISKATN